MQTKQSIYSISEAARELELSAEWLREGEKRGSLPKAKRDRNGYRVYGLDLGQSADYTALAVVERVGGDEKALHLRHLERYPLRTLYPDIAEGVTALMRDPRLSPDETYGLRTRRSSPELVGDQTGVGPAVTDLLKKRGLGFRPITITGGNETSYSGGTWRVPKRDLVGALEVPFHTGQLKVAEGLTLWPALREELLNFRRKINLKTAHDSYEHWRECDHDDLVLATALACWWITRRQRGTTKLRVHRTPAGF